MENDELNGWIDDEIESWIWEKQTYATDRL